MSENTNDAANEQDAGVAQVQPAAQPEGEQNVVDAVPAINSPVEVTDSAEPWQAIRSLNQYEYESPPECV